MKLLENPRIKPGSENDEYNVLTHLGDTEYKATYISHA